MIDATDLRPAITGYRIQSKRTGESALVWPTAGGSSEGLVVIVDRDGRPHGLAGIPEPLQRELTDRSVGALWGLWFACRGGWR